MKVSTPIPRQSERPQCYSARSRGMTLGALGMTEGEASSFLDAAMTEVRAIIFDWNGTVVDDVDRALTATNYVLQRYRGTQLDPLMFGDRFKLPLATFFRELGIGEADLVEAHRLWNDRLALDSTRLQPGVEGFLRAAGQHGITVGVVSAATEAAVRADAESLGIDRYLAFIEGSVHDKVATLTEIVSGMSGKTIYVGDTEYDMAAAEAAGAIGIGFGRGYRPRSALIETSAVAVIDDYAVMCSAFNRCFAQP